MIALIASPFKKYTPKFSRFAVIYTCTDFMFTADKAKKDLDFEPKYSDEVAMQNTIAYYSKQKLNNRS
jgi:nucleoside-diphosphate-sugar epimerase